MSVLVWVGGALILTLLLIIHAQLLDRREKQQERWNRRRDIEEMDRQNVAMTKKMRRMSDESDEPDESDEQTISDISENFADI